MIDYGIDIPTYIKCMPNTLFVEKIEYGDKVSKGGIIIQKEKMDHYGNFVRPRWAKVKYKAENLKMIEVGDWVLLKHGNWSTSMQMTIKGKSKDVWYVSPKSFKEGVMAISKTMPEHLKEYGITDD